MSFVDEEDIFKVIEGCMEHVFKQVGSSKELKIPLEKMPFDEALKRFGSEKPDVRFGLELERRPVAVTVWLNEVCTLPVAGFISSIMAST